KQSPKVVPARQLVLSRGVAHVEALQGRLHRVLRVLLAAQGFAQLLPRQANEPMGEAAKDFRRRLLVAGAQPSWKVLRRRRIEHATFPFSWALAFSHRRDGARNKNAWQNESRRVGPRRQRNLNNSWQSGPFVSDWPDRGHDRLVRLNRAF